jgi:hypothetical protein
MKKKVLVLATLVIAMAATTVKAQLNVGSVAVPDASAVLQVSSTTKGVRLPNVALTTTTTFGLTAPTSAPAAIGMVVYNTTTGITSSNVLYPAAGVGTYTWDGTGWIAASSSKADVRIVGGGAFNNHISADAGVGSNGTNMGTGSANVAIGTSSMSSNTSGANNVAVGINALGQNTQGTNNVAIGPGTLGQNKTATDNVAIGNNALYNNSGANSNGNIAIGSNTLYNNNNVYGLHVAIGLNALNANTSGYANVGVGYNSLNANTTGNFNTAYGTSSMELNQIGSQNTSIGYQSLYNSKGSFNVALGVGAGTNQTAGDNNILIGKNVNAQFTTGSNQMNLGNMISGQFIDGSGTGGNMAIGYGAVPINGAITLDVSGITRVRKAFAMGIQDCPIANSAPTAYNYTMSVSDVAYSIFRITSANYVSGLTLISGPGMTSGGYTTPDGQILRIINVSSSPVIINGTNTDNAATITLAGIGTAGLHGVEYIWGGSANAWIRLQ